LGWSLDEYEAGYKGEGKDSLVKTEIHDVINDDIVNKIDNEKVIIHNNTINKGNTINNSNNNDNFNTKSSAIDSVDKINLLNTAMIADKILPKKLYDNISPLSSSSKCEGSNTSEDFNHLLLSSSKSTDDFDDKNSLHTLLSSKSTEDFNSILLSSITESDDGVRLNQSLRSNANI
jgi:hypothetical protein